MDNNDKNENLQSAETENTTPAKDSDSAAAPVKNKKKYTFKNFVNDVFEILETVLLWAFALRLLFIFVIGNAVVDGDSMVPTLINEEKLIYYQLAYTPSEGDIVIINSTEKLGKVIVKRVIATEGQTVDINFETSEVIVDGNVLDEPYINNATRAVSPAAFESYPITVPEGCIFVMGDNRGVSLDSRHASLGFVKKEDVLGKVVFRYSVPEESDNSIGVIKSAEY